MSTGRTKTISFPKKDYDIKDYLSNIDNMSEYIIDLVRKDIENKQSNDDEKLDRIINELMVIKEMINSRTFANLDKGIEPKAEQRLNRLLNILKDDEE